MRILCLGKNQEHVFAASWYYMLKQIAEKHELITYGPKQRYESKWTQNLDYGRASFLPVLYTKLMRSLDRNKYGLVADVITLASKYHPDVILVDSTFPQFPSWKNLDKVDVPVALVISDPHYEFVNKLRYASTNHISLCLFDCKFVMKWPTFLKWKRNNENVLCEWLPHCVDTKVFRNYKQERYYDVVSAGISKGSLYPLRKAIMKTLRDAEGIKFAMPQHAIYDLMNGAEPSRVLIRENYARFIADSRIFIFGPSIYKYAIQKYYEGMACNTLVMAPTPNDAEDLHFKAGENFVEINETNFLKGIRHFLENSDERLEIARRGHETVQQYHTVEKREAELHSYLKQIV